MAHPSADSLAQEETSVERTTKRLISNWLSAQPLVRLTFTTVHTGTKENFTTKVKWSWKRRKPSV